LFKRLLILHVTCNDSFAWWHINEGQFSNVTFLIKQILSILGTQIGRGRMVNCARMLTSLWHCCLQVENFDWIIIIVKNWPNDPCLNCKKKMNMKEYMKVKVSLADDNYDLIKEWNISRSEM
jgi:hypothetical protein